MKDYAPDSFGGYFYGTSYNDYLVGTDTRDIINGMDGNDTLIGKGGMDTLSGGNGNDYLNAGNGVYDVLDGGSGDDYLTSWGDGGDLNREHYFGGKSYSGGSGNDTLVAKYAPQVSMDGGSGRDRFLITGKNMHVQISDLNIAGGEKITLVQDSNCRYNLASMSIGSYSMSHITGTRFYDKSNDLTVDVRWLNPSQATTSIFKVA